MPLTDEYVSKRFETLKYFNENQTEVINAQTYYKRYTMEKIPIQDRADLSYISDDSLAPNEKYANAFEKEIVDTRINYCLSNPIDIRLNRDDEDFRNRIDYFLKNNNFNNFISNSGKLTGACGYSGILLYIKEVEEYKVGDVTYNIGEKAPHVDVRLKKLKPWEFYVHRNEDDTETIEAIRYYGLTYHDENGTEKKVYYGEYYDNEYVYYMDSSNESSGYEVREVQPHLCGQVPMFIIKNNDDKKPSFYESMDLINAYNNCLSDYGNEIQSFRLAYLLLKGLDASNDTLDAMRHMRALKVDAEGDVRFVTKELNTQAFELLLNTLEKNIERFSGHVDYTDPEIYGRATNLAVKTRIKPLDSRAKSYALELTAGLNDMFKCLFSIFKEAGEKSWNWQDINVTFNYDTPINDLEEVEKLLMLHQMGFPYEDLYGLASFVTDEKAIMERMKKEKEIDFGAFSTVLEEDTMGNPELNARERVNTKKVT